MKYVKHIIGLQREKTDVFFVRLVSVGFFSFILFKSTLDLIVPLKKLG